MAGDVQILGLEEVLKNLKNIEKGIDEDFNGSALFGAALPIVKELKANAPVLSGKTRDNIKRKRIKAGGFTNEVVVYLADKGFVGRFSEFGTGAHIVIKAGRAAKINGRYLIGPIRHPGQPERPWFRPAFDASASSAIKRYAVILTKKIKSLVS